MSNTYYDPKYTASTTPVATMKWSPVRDTAGGADISMDFGSYRAWVYSNLPLSTASAVGVGKPDGSTLAVDGSGTWSIPNSVAAVPSTLFGWNSSSVPGAVAIGSGLSLSGGTLSVGNAVPRVVSGTTDILLASDNGGIVFYNNATSTAVTVPSGLPSGYNVTLVEGNGAGHFTVTGASGVAIIAGDGSTAPFRSVRNDAIMSVLSLSGTQAAVNGGMH